MRIAYIYNSLTRVGGTEHILIQKMNYLADVYGGQIFVITNEQNNEKCSFPLSDNVTHIDIDVQLWKKYLVSLPFRFWADNKLRNRYRKKLQETLEQINPDIIVCCHSFLPGLICSLPIRAKKVIEAHNPRNMLAFTRGFLSYYIEKYQREKELDLAEKYCDAVVTLTTGDALSWKIAKRVEVIPDMVEPYKKHDYFLSSKKVVSLGRLVPQKGYDRLIDAWKEVCGKHPDWTLEIYGDGELKNALQEKINKSNLSEWIHLKPFTHDVEGVVADSSFLVCSSRFEGFGMTLVEAMMIGRPVVSFDCPYGPEDIIKEGKNGLLATNGKVQDLADKICYMIENPTQRQQMAAAALLLSTKYLPQNIMPTWKLLFESL